jgi:CRISPR-associated exonuclease Cas4
MPYLALLLILIALLLLWQSARQKKSAGIPGGRVIYTDTRAWGQVEKPLYDESLGLTGRPDYLLEQGKTIIPIEVKSTRIPDSPYDAHIYQVAAYCLLVERVFGKRPPYGILHYSDRSNKTRTFAIDYTAQLEAAVIETLAEIRSLDKRKNVPRSHDSVNRCERCGFRSLCEERLSR